MLKAGLALVAATAFSICGCSHAKPTASNNAENSQPNSENSRPAFTQSASTSSSAQSPGSPFVGFDRNDYPGDDTMSSMHNTFNFTGYWLTTPPGENTNTWAGKRDLLRSQGWGFLVLANGKLDAEILKAQKSGTTPATLGKRDATNAVAAAKREGFPAQTIIFLDQEEGGRLLDEQAAYLLGWTEAVAASDYRPGVYASGQRVQDSPGVWIDTIEDIRARVKKGGLHEIAIFNALDRCPPSPGCTLHAKPLSATPDLNLTAWQYSQSPRRPEITQSCGSTYAADGNCYAPGFPSVFLDMDAADSADPSHGR
jgi:Domain of unknown function (DUF1906)